MNMPRKSSESANPQATVLRGKAEEIVQEKTARLPENLEALSPEEIRLKLHELRVHQIELEMQNEELRTMQAELDAARERYFDLYDLAPVGYCTVSEKGLILETNLTAASLLGLARGALIKQPISRFILEEDQDIYYLQRKQLSVMHPTSSGQTGESQTCELRMVKNDGTTLWVRLDATVAQYKDLSTVYRVVLSDVSRHKQAQAEKEKIADQNRQLQKVESLSRMAGAIAHHFNNQLQVVTGNLEIAMNDLPMAVNPIESLVSAMQAARKAAEISGLMLTYLGQTPGKQEHINLTEACSRSLAAFENAAPKGMILKADFPSTGPFIRADMDQIKKVLSYLVTNAWEAAGANPGTIGLTVKTVSGADIPNSKRFPIAWYPREIDYACLEVTDSGCGITNNDIEKLFDPFFTTKFTGRGFGLPVVLGIAGAHGGGITVESEPDRGSVFRIFLPVSDEEIPLQQKNTVPIPKEDLFTLPLVNPWLLSTYRQPADLDNNSHAVQISSIDVADRNNSHKALQQLAKQHHDLMELVPDIVMIHDVQMILYINHTGAIMLGAQSPEEIVGKPVLDFFSSASWRINQQRFCQVMNGHKVDCLEQEMSRLDKNLIWVECISIPSISDGSQAILTVGRNINKRKMAQKALRESEERFRSTFEQAAVGICHVGKEGQFLRVNQKLCNMLGYTRDELLSMTIKDVTHPEDLKISREAYERLFSGDQVIEKIEKRYICKNGHTMWGNLTASVLKEPDGAPEFFISVVEDISSKKTAEKEKEILENQLHQAQRLEAIGTLAGGIAHDFNNILYPIIGFAEMTLEDLPPGSPTGGFQKQIIQAAGRAQELIKRILAFSREIEPEVVPVHLKELIQETCQLLRATLPSTIEMNLESLQNTGYVKSAPVLIHQVIMNLCTNAFHAMAASGGILKLELDSIELDDFKNIAGGEYHRLIISDTGCGMPHAILNRIFHPYFTTKEKGKGTGLGLSTVHGIVKQLKGHITVTSLPGKGTFFIIYLPVYHPDETLSEPLPMAVDLKGKEHILLVDDEEMILEMLQNMLSRLGYQVTGCLTSLEALDLFSSNPDRFHLVITDLTMPRMTGVQLSQKIQTIKPDVPIILCTGYSDLLDENTAKAIGIRKLVTKPVLKADLIAAIQNILSPS